MSIEEVVQGFPFLGDHTEDFERMAEAVFRFQVEHNDVYRRFVGDHTRWNGWKNAPALPVEAFKHAPITTFPVSEAERMFESSGTGGMQRSRHYVRDLSVYDHSALTHFASHFGSDPGIILGHLPGYQEGGSRSSLVYMVERLIDTFGAPGSGLFIEDLDALHRASAEVAGSGKGLILFGAAFGLLDLVEAQTFSLPPQAIVIETGGMKTYRRSITRHYLHVRLAVGFGIPRENIRSEYGMAELLSQCYTTSDGLFRPPPWMRFKVVDIEQPEIEVEEGREGALCLFDLANVYTVSSIATQDLAVRRKDGFEIIGRVTGAELRGCNFLLENHA